MQLPLSWIKEYVDLDLSAEELAYRLTMAGIETVCLGSSVPDFEGVITAKIDKIEKHPRADKLTVCQVRPSPSEEPLTVVCGAPNISEGDIVPLARPGAVLADGMKLKKSKIRGVESRGMMCSQKELGVSDDHTGIWILPPQTPVGKTLPEALGQEDEIIETEPTPNRGDLLSVIGVAREVAAITGAKMRLPQISLNEQGPRVDELASVEIKNYEACPRYVARLIKSLKPGPSPQWMKQRLEQAGMRSINNVVDVTNYVMLEIGQPLHAFDFNKLHEQRIVVKNAEQGDKFTTLDGCEHTLRHDTLMICDGKGPVAVAGVMGGLESEVSEQTTDVLLESAYFNPVSVRRTARLLGIPTEASRRFDKGVDPMGTVFAADRAADLISELAGGKLSKGYIDARDQGFEKKRITLRPERSNRILGIEVPADQQAETLSRLDGIEVKQEGNNLEVLAPFYRPDLEHEHDLIEEIARLTGYDRIPATMPGFRMEPMPGQKELDLARLIRQRMSALGFSEAILTSFENPESLRLLNLPESDHRRRAVRIANPLSENESVMRTTLVPKLLQTYHSNRSRGATRGIRLYEINAVFEDTGEELPRQRTMMTGLFSPPTEKTLWEEDGRAEEFYDIKAVAEQVLAATGHPAARIQGSGDEPFIHPGKCARAVMGSSYAGSFGELHPLAARNFDIKHPVFIFELHFGMLAEHYGYVPKAKKLSKFPPALRDIAVVVDEEVTMEQVIRAAMKMKSQGLANMDLFDIFRGGSVPPGKKSMAFHLKYQSMERTLTDDEVNKEHGRLAQQLQRKVGASLR